MRTRDGLRGSADRTDPGARQRHRRRNDRIRRREHVPRDRLRDGDRPTGQRLRRRPRGLLRRSDRAVQNVPDPTAQSPVLVLDAARPDLERRAQRTDLRRAVAGAPRLDRRRTVRGRSQRALRPERSARLLRPVPAAPAADAVHVYGRTRAGAVGNPPDEAVRRLPAARHPAASPRRRIGRSGMRANRARGRGRGLAPPPPRGSIAPEGPWRRRSDAVPNGADTGFATPSRTGHAAARSRRDDPHRFRRRPASAEEPAVACSSPVSPGMVETSSRRQVTDRSPTGARREWWSSRGNADRLQKTVPLWRCHEAMRSAVTRPRPALP